MSSTMRFAVGTALALLVVLCLTLQVAANADVPAESSCVVCHDVVGYLRKGPLTSDRLTHVCSKYHQTKSLCTSVSQFALIHKQTFMSDETFNVCLALTLCTEGDKELFRDKRFLKGLFGKKNDNSDPNAPPPKGGINVGGLLSSVVGGIGDVIAARNAPGNKKANTGAAIAGALGNVIGASTEGNTKFQGLGQVLQSVGHGTANVIQAANAPGHKRTNLAQGLVQSLGGVAATAAAQGKAPNAMNIANSIAALSSGASDVIGARGDAGQIIGSVLNTADNVAAAAGAGSEKGERISNIVSGVTGGVRDLAGAIEAPGATGLNVINSLVGSIGNVAGAAGNEKLQKVANVAGHATQGITDAVNIAKAPGSNFANVASALLGGASNAFHEGAKSPKGHLVGDILGGARDVVDSTQAPGHKAGNIINAIGGGLSSITGQYGSEKTQHIGGIIGGIAQDVGSAMNHAHETGGNVGQAAFFAFSMRLIEELFESSEMSQGEKDFERGLFAGAYGYTPQDLELYVNSVDSSHAANYEYVLRKNGVYVSYSGSYSSHGSYQQSSSGFSAEYGSSGSSNFEYSSGSTTTYGSSGAAGYSTTGYPTPQPYPETTPPPAGGYSIVDGGAATNYPDPVQGVTGGADPGGFSILGGDLNDFLMP